MFKFKMLIGFLIICASFSGIYCYTDAPDNMTTLNIYKGESTNWLSKVYDFKPRCSCLHERGTASVDITRKHWLPVVRRVSEHSRPKYQCEVKITRVDDESDGVLVCTLYSYDARNHFEERVRLVLKERELSEKWHKTESLDTTNKDPTKKSVSPREDDTDKNINISEVPILNPTITDAKWSEPQVKYLPLGKPWTWKFKEMENILSCDCYILNAKGTKLVIGEVTITTVFGHEINKDTCELKVPEVNDQMNGLIRCEIITKADVHTIEEALVSSSAAHTESPANGWKVAACILIVALLILTAVLLWLLLRKRCRTMWSPKEHKEQLLNEVVTNQSRDSTGKYEETIDDTSNKASYAVTTPPKPEVKTAVSDKPNTDQKSAEQRLNATERKPSAAENSNENKKAESPTAMTEVVERNGFQMPAAAVTTNNSMGQENSPEIPAKVSSMSGDQDEEAAKTPETKSPESYQLNMIKNCFGEALTRMNQKKPLIPKKPSRKSLKEASSTENLEDYDQPANIIRPVGQPDNAKTPDVEQRPKSVMTQNDLYVSADADEQDEKPASILRAVLDVGPKTPLIRPPTAFISEDDFKTGGREEYDSPRSFARPAPAIPSPKLKSSKEAAIDNESDPETDDLYDSPSCVLRKLSYPRT